MQILTINVYSQTGAPRDGYKMNSIAICCITGVGSLGHSSCKIGRMNLQFQFGGR